MLNGVRAVANALALALQTGYQSQHPQLSSLLLDPDPSSMVSALLRTAISASDLYDDGEITNSYAFSVLSILMGSLAILSRTSTSAYAAIDYIRSIAVERGLSLKSPLERRAT